jgi:hypothetical protein
MSYLARLYDFTPSTLIQSAQVDAEFAQLVDILGGAKTDTQVKIVHAAATSLLELDNTGGGLVASFKVAGVEKAKVNASGQFESTIATGTAPFVVASTTAVTNLNADTVDGVHGTNLLVDNAASQTIDGGATTVIEIKSDTLSTLRFLDDIGGSNPHMRIQTDGTSIMEWYRYNGTDTHALLLDLSSTGVLRDGSGNQYATQAYVETKKTAWSYGVFYAGGVDPSVIQAIWVVPDDVDTMQVDHLKWVYQSGSPTGTTQIKLQHKNSLGVEQNTTTISILSTDGSLKTLTSDIADWTLAVDDFLQWTIVADGGHQDISIHAQGWQSMI